MPYDIGPIEQSRGPELLFALADVLEQVPPEHYDQRNWRCGSVMCGLGWAAEKKIAGLRWSEDGFEGLICRADGSLTPGASALGFTAYNNLMLATEAFGLTFKEAELLFGGGFEITARYYLGPKARYPRPSDITPKIAADGLRRMATTKLLEKAAAHAL